MRIAKLIGIGFLLAIAACAPTFRTHGYAPSAAAVEEIIPGVDDSATVEAAFGRPTASGIVSDRDWIYVETTLRFFTYNKPEVTERRVVAVSFDETGLVSDIRELGIEDGRVVNLNKRITESNGRTLGVLEQLFGNLGRITGDQALGGQE